MPAPKQMRWRFRSAVAQRTFSCKAVSARQARRFIIQQVLDWRGENRFRRFIAVPEKHVMCLGPVTAESEAGQLELPWPPGV